MVVEAESSKIGNLLIPPSVWAAMRAAPRVRLSAPLSARARYLTRAYADMIADPAALNDTLGLLVQFHGHDQVQAWQAMVAQGRFETLAAELMERHYDARYGKSREAREGATFAEIALNDLGQADLEHAAERLAERLAAFEPAF